MSGKNADAADDAARSIVTTRVIDAPRALVFEAWTDPRHLAAWWGPNGFTTTTTVFDMRPGGVWRFVMHGPDGRDYENRIVFDDVAPPERISYRHDGGEDEGVEDVQFATTVTFEDLGGKTRITLHALFASAEERERVAREYGAVEGAQQTIARLAGYAVELAGLPTEEPTVKSIVLVRTFAAPRELVWKAWTDPAHLAAWWGPHHFTAPVCELDVRPGGGLRIDMQGPEGPANMVTGVFRDVVEHERLSFTTEAFRDEHGHPALAGFNVITFAQHDHGTTLTIEAHILKAADWLAAGIAGMNEGWSQSLEKLDAEVAGMEGSDT